MTITNKYDHSHFRSIGRRVAQDILEGESGIYSKGLNFRVTPEMRSDFAKKCRQRRVKQADVLRLMIQGFIDEA